MGRFVHTFSLSGVMLNNTPTGLLSFMNQLNLAHLYAVGSSVSGDVILDSFAIQLSDEVNEDPEADPLLQCLSDVEQLVGKLTTSSTGLAEELRDNLVHANDDFSSGGIIFVTQMEYAQPENVTIGSIQVIQPTSFSNSIFFSNPIIFYLGALQFHRRVSETCSTESSNFGVETVCIGAYRNSTKFTLHKQFNFQSKSALILYFSDWMIYFILYQGQFEIRWCRNS